MLALRCLLFIIFSPLQYIYFFPHFLFLPTQLTLYNSSHTTLPKSSSPLQPPFPSALTSERRRRQNQPLWLVREDNALESGLLSWVDVWYKISALSHSRTSGYLQRCVSMCVSTCARIVYACVCLLCPSALARCSASLSVCHSINIIIWRWKFILDLRSGCWTELYELKVDSLSNASYSLHQRNEFSQLWKKFAHLISSSHLLNIKNIYCILN